jgi:hypothetical protein
MPSMKARPTSNIPIQVSLNVELGHLAIGSLELRADDFGEQLPESFVEQVFLLNPINAQRGAIRIVDSPLSIEEQDRLWQLVHDRCQRFKRGSVCRRRDECWCGIAHRR